MYNLKGWNPEIYWLSQVNFSVIIFIHKAMYWYSTNKRLKSFWNMDGIFFEFFKVKMGIKCVTHEHRLLVNYMAKCNRIKEIIHLHSRLNMLRY